MRIRTRAHVCEWAKLVHVQSKHKQTKCTLLLLINEHFIQVNHVIMKCLTTLDDAESLSLKVSTYSFMATTVKAVWATLFLSLYKKNEITH